MEGEHRYHGKSIHKRTRSNHRGRDGNDRHRSNSQRKEQRDSPHLYNSRSAKSMAASIALSKDEKSASEFYTVDRRGNIQNLQYGSLSEYDIPRYRTIGYGRVLGLDSRFRVSRDTRQVEEIQADPGARSRHGYPSLLSMG